MAIKGHKHLSEKQGFTLVELSIVLVIIGLIVAGVTAGQVLVSQAQVRTIIKDINEFNTAFKTFQLTYAAVPGDMDNAYDYWGTDCDVTDTDCNGGGNGLVDTGGTATQDEVFRALQHMALAGIIKGDYDEDEFATTNLPVLPETGSDCYLRIYYHNNQTPTGHYIAIGARRSGTYNNNNGCVTPAQAKSADTKIDNGLDSSGILRGLDGADVTSANDCASSGYTVGTTYDACRFLYNIDKK